MTADATQRLLITGGTRGLGAAIVDRLLSQGHHVATCGRSRSEAVDRWEQSAAAERFHFEPLDLGDAEAIPDYVERVRKRLGRIDVLVNNAAIANDGVLALETTERIDAMLNVNLRAAIVLAKYCSRWMLVQRGGSIINISSIIAQHGFSGLAVYAATKSALEGLTRALARELGPRGIRVNALAPGYLATEMSASLDDAQRQQIVRRTPLGRLGTVDDIVPWVEFLISPGAGYLTGQVITIDGGSMV